MEIECIWEHNGENTLLYAKNLPGAYTRGETLASALGKMPQEAAAYLRWLGNPVPDVIEPRIVQEKQSELCIRDADSDVIFYCEREPMTLSEYRSLKALALKSAADFLALYNAVPDKNRSATPVRKTFYGDVPRTAEEMCRHTKSVNEYYFAEIDVPADNEGTILECRARGFDLLEGQEGFPSRGVIDGSYGEEWSLRKVLRRFVWHDRIHARAMYRMAIKAFGHGSVPDVFRFEG